MHHGTLPFGWVAVVFGSDWPMFLVLIAILLWVFPDGRLPPGRWRRVSVALVAAGLLVGLVGLAPGIVAVAGHDVHVEASGNLSAPSRAWAIAGYMTIIAVLASWLGWLVVQVPGYRRSSGERRQQLKWLYSGATAFLALLCISLFAVPLAFGDSPGSGPPVTGDLFNLGVAVLPVCIGVAVLKYRLYAIDRIISRVISYAIITVVLAGVFAGLVLLATDVLPVKTPVAVAAATLAAAALFNPLRRRVQRAVDRRFNRTRYNAEAIVAAFTARLRQHRGPRHRAGRSRRRCPPSVRARSRLGVGRGDRPARSALMHALPRRQLICVRDTGLAAMNGDLMRERRATLPQQRSRA